MAKVISVIENYESEGRGTTDNPYRSVLTYYSFDGEMLLKDHSVICDIQNDKIEELKKELKEVKDNYLKLSTEYNTIVMSSNKREALRKIASKKY